MDLELSGHSALVTASTSGIGLAIADRLAREGCAVLVHGRDDARARTAVDALRTHGADAVAVLGDLTDDDAADRVVRAARDRGVDVVVANAGPFAEHDWDDAETADWLAGYDANVGSVVRVVRPLLADLRARGWGRVVTLGARSNTTPLPNMVDYSAAKAAVLNLTRSLAKHLAGTGVTANCVSPGVTSTEGLRTMFEAREPGVPWEELEPAVTRTYAPNPVGRLGTAEDIADAVAFLASARASYVTGEELRVDGGITL